MADGEFQNPAAPQKIPGFPENFSPLVFSGFAGLNTKATRPAIEDQQMAWTDNWMPLGKSNLRTLYDVGSPIFTAATGASVSAFYFANIADTPISVVFNSNGSITQVNTTNNVTKAIAPAGTIADPTKTMSIAQWGSQYIAICAPQTNGYFLWDGNVFYAPGTIGPAVTISNSGLDYTSVPTITPFGGFGTGATFSSTVASSGSVTQITVTNAGSGYGATDVVGLAFSGGGSNTTARGTVTISGGLVQSIAVAVSGSGYTQSSVNVSLQGGGGIGATASATVGAGGAITSYTVTNSGNGYTSAPTVIVTDPNNPVAQATVNIMPFGIQGTAIETFSNRVWIANGDAPSTPPPKSRVVFTAPGSPTDFSVGDGAGAFVSTDSFLRVGYHSMKQSNGFLYLIGDSSVNYISGLQVTGTPPITTFSNLNVDPQIGSPWPNSVQVYSRSIVFANTFGIHALYGGAVQKVSTPLDGIYTTVPAVGETPTIGGLKPSSAVTIIFGIHVYMLLLPIIDAFTGQQVNKLMCWDGAKWWTAQPSVTLTQIASQEINSLITAYGTDGHSIYPLFQTPSNGITKVLQSKLWDNPSYMMTKNSSTLFGLFKSNDTNAASFNFTVDTENGSSSPVTVTNVFGVTWTATGGVVASWTATGGLPVTWQAAGLGQLLPTTINASGVLMGIGTTSTATDVTLISLTLLAQQTSPNW
jgi:hypothetical protein